MNFVIEVTGTSPLLMHNPQMVDPQFELNREIKELTKKRKKTDEDLRQIEKLEWYGGLYLDGANGQKKVVQPTSKLRKCMIEAGRITKEGKQVERAVSFSDVYVELIHDGPKDIDALYKSGRYVSRLAVVVNNKRIMRCRPQFLPWKMAVPGALIPDAGLNPENLESILRLAGEAVGIGDNRVNGYGRFKAVIHWEEE